MSEKLDGVRGYWTGKKLISRSGNPFHAPNWFTKNFPSTPLDGELWLGRQQFSELVSIVRRKVPDANWKRVRYLIFDAPQVEGGFEKRLDFARRWFQQHPNPYAEVLEQQICENEAHLRTKLREIESLGGEGIHYHPWTWHRRGGGFLGVIPGLLFGRAGKEDHACHQAD